MDNRQKAMNLIGLATKAGKAVSGEFSTEKAVKQGKAELVVVGMDASDNTKKRFDDMCSFRNVPIYFYASKEELGKAIGKEMRSSAAVLNKGLAEKIIGQLESQK